MTEEPLKRYDNKMKLSYEFTYAFKSIANNKMNKKIKKF